jgi:hypothetical protein
VIFNFWKRLFCFILVLMLTACAVQQKLEFRQVTELGESSRDDFMNSMRWKRFKIAASLIQPEQRQDFMATFRPLKDIHITDVRLADLRTDADGRRFETSIDMDYYLLPSVTVKTFRFDQTWVYSDGDGPTPKGFFITTPFPEFP